MLELLSLRKGTTLTKEMFLNHLYGGMDEAGIEDHRRLHLQASQETRRSDGRRQYIETVWGRGYVLRDPSGAQARLAATA